MRARLSDYQEKYAPELFNLEATPAESTAFRFAKHDTERFPDIKTANDHGTPYYTNSTNLPVGTTDDVFEALDVQDHFQPLYTSGTVFHTFLGEKLPDWKSAAKLVKTITDNYKLPYVSISPTYSVCPDHGYVTGEHFKCPICGKEAEVYSRITGYYRPVKNWNDGKAQEFKDRKVYDAARSGVLLNRGTSARKSAPAPAAREKADPGIAASRNTVQKAPAGTGNGIPTMYVKDHCPKCKGAEQRFKLNGVAFNVVNCSEHMDIARELEITQTPTIIDPDGTRYIGEHAAVAWLGAHKDAAVKRR
jgi:ribonucleoside-triphosphate reductase